VFIPKRNEPDLDDVPAEVLDLLDVRPVSDVGEILGFALEQASTPGATETPTAHAAA
jgi:ATP-dependent Lon protease